MKIDKWALSAGGNKLSGQPGRSKLQKAYKYFSAGQISREIFTAEKISQNSNFAIENARFYRRKNLAQYLTCRMEKNVPLQFRFIFDQLICKQALLSYFFSRELFEKASVLTSSALSTFAAFAFKWALVAGDVAVSIFNLILKVLLNPTLIAGAISGIFCDCANKSMLEDVYRTIQRLSSQCFSFIYSSACLRRGLFVQSS